MNNAFYRFLKTESAKQKEVSTGMALLDEAFRIPIGSSLLIEGSSSVGTTAVALQLASQLSKQNKVIVYFDVFNTGIFHRFCNIDLDRLVIIRPWALTPPQLLDCIESLSACGEELVLVFDNCYMLENLWSNWNFVDFAKRIYSLNSEITIIATQRKLREELYWPVVIRLEHIQNMYAETEDGATELAGHLLKVIGPYGHSMVYLDHYTGTISDAYEYAILSVKSGQKTKTSTFEFDGISVRGAWKLVYEIGKKRRNELQIDQMYYSKSN